MMQGPEGRPPNVSPARKGWEIEPEEDPSAVGAARNRSSALSVSLGAYPDFLLHRSLKRPRMWFSLKRTTCSRPKPELSTGNPGEPTCPGVPWRDLQFRGPFLEVFFDRAKWRAG